MKFDARTVATHVLTEVIIQKHSLSDCLENHLANLSDSRDKALAQTLCYGVLRWLPRLQAILRHCVAKPLKEKDQDIEILLLIGLYQFLYLRIPDHAAISATVEVARHLKKEWAVKLVNGVLRNFQRQQQAILLKIDQQITARLAHPHWFLKKLQQDWPQQWEAIALANNEHPPLTLRVNTRQISVSTYLQSLQQAHIIAYQTDYTETGITLNQAMDVKQLPGFEQGWFSVQDGAAQLAATLLDVSEQATVLDACAAPGGKTAHLLEKYSIGTLLALDNQPDRVKRLQNTLARLKLSAQVRCADATNVNAWWNQQPFDRILLDVPCSASGVIRRHPDIKILRQPSDITQLVQQQAQLLTTIWQTLKPNGKLLYITCSVFAEENQLQIQNFLQKQSDAREIPIITDWGHALPVGRQILPGEHQFDGFYYACLTKVN